MLMVRGVDDRTMQEKELSSLTASVLIGCTSLFDEKQHRACIQ